MGYGVFRKHPSLSKTQACKNVELNVSKNCDALFYLMTPFYEIVIRTLFYVLFERRVVRMN